MTNRREMTREEAQKWFREYAFWCDGAKFRGFGVSVSERLLAQAKVAAETGDADMFSRISDVAEKLAKIMRRSIATA